MNPRISFFLSFATIILGFVQFFAVLELFDYIGLHVVLNALLSAFFVLYLPIIAAFIGFFGMVYVWAFTWFHAGLVLFGSLLFYILLEYLGLGYSNTIRITKRIVKDLVYKATNPFKK